MTSHINYLSILNIILSPPKILLGEVGGFLVKQYTQSELADQINLRKLVYFKNKNYLLDYNKQIVQLQINSYCKLWLLNQAQQIFKETEFYFFKIQPSD